MKIHAIGGYNEVGKNMTAIEIGDDIILLDCGLFLPAIVGVAEREKIPTERGMRTLGALPDDLYLEKKGLKNKVIAMIISHAHLDHVGAIPYNAPRYNCPVIGTPFTMEVLKVLMRDSNQRIPNKIISVPVDGHTIIHGKKNAYKIEFVNMTHSTIQSAVVAIHTPEGIVLYTNDYKLDNTPIAGDRPNYKRLKELSRIGIKAIVADCLYAPDDRKTPSEKIARGLLEDVLFTTDNRKSGLVITTFSSHIARLKTIAEFGKRLNREVIFVGRSLSKYMEAARNVGKADFAKDIQILTFRKHLEKTLGRVSKNKKDFIVVCTGHQGEPGSVLDRISRDKIPLKLGKDDQVIFSSKTIPTPINELNKEQMAKRLKKLNVRIFDNVHVSGHGGREDLRDLLKLTSPEHVIPSHGDLKKRTAGGTLAEELGYKMNKTIHLLNNGTFVTL
ncbi:MBL fold metallo-hydrolase [Candidatus Pacearchaeota archaeon]|nr:MBL fold metallo-hydrolase [Candidatus Pacearchaeota archaeon]